MDIQDIMKQAENDTLNIIEIAADENGRHGYQGQSGRKECWLEGWIAVPTKELADKISACGTYCDLVIQDGVLVDVTQNMDAYEAAKAVQAAEEEERRQAELEKQAQNSRYNQQIRADVDYLSVMTGVQL